MSVAATVVVQFGTGVDSSALVVVELDGEVNLDLEGKEKTSFAPEDSPFFLVHHDAALRVERVTCSSGMVSGGALVVRSRSQQLQFAGEESQDLPHLPASSPTWQWYGNAPQISRDGRTLTPSGALPAIGEASYRIKARQYQLTPPPLVLVGDENYPILIVIHMEAA